MVFDGKYRNHCGVGGEDCSLCSANSTLLTIGVHIARHHPSSGLNCTAVCVRSGEQCCIGLLDTVDDGK